MQYASELSLSTSVHQWKPCTPEQFTAGLHRASVDVCDEGGRGGVHHQTAKLDRETIATVWYMPKDRGHAISTPILMSMTVGSGKPVLFVSIEYGSRIGLGLAPATLRPDYPHPL